MNVSTLAVVLAALLVMVFAGLSLISNQAAAQAIVPPSVAVTDGSANRYYLMVVRDEARATSERYLVDSRDGRVWAWSTGERREFVLVPTVEKPSAGK